MPRKFQYKCTRCGTQPGDTPEQARENLYIMRVEFRSYGAHARVIKVRTIAWLCRACMRNDPIFNQAPQVVAGNQVING